MSFEDQVSNLMGNHELELENSRRNVILVIGRTGVGKSTMAEILFGDLSALEATPDRIMLCVTIKNTKSPPQPKQEEHSMFQSNTICPQLFTDPTKPALAIYDCPGFADTRGTSNEIATGVYLSEIVRHADRVKLVVTVDFDTVKPNADRDKFTDRILPEVLDFVLNNEIYDGGVFLLVTKYANLLDAVHKFTDDEIVRSIVEFLKAAQKHAAKYAKDKKQKSAINALFENSWLQKVNGTYPNIAFSRTITDEGPLSDMDHLTRRGQIRHQLLDNPHFVFKPSDRSYFGCPISDTAKLEIRKAQKKLCAEAEVLLKTLGEEIINKFVDSTKDHQKLSNFVQQYNVFLKKMDKLPEAESGLTVKTLAVLRLFGNNIGVTNIDREINWLNSIVKCLKHLSSVDVQESAAIWNDAHGKLDHAQLSMAKDLITEIRKAQRDLASEARVLLELLGQKVVIKLAKSTDNLLFVLFQAFVDKLKELPKAESGFSTASVNILHEFGDRIAVDMGSEVDKLTGIIGCLKYLTGVDAQLSSTTWADVNLMWNHSIEFMKKDSAQVKAQRDMAEAEAQGKIAIAKAEAELLEAKTKGELAEEKAKRELADARAEAERVKAQAEKELLLAQIEKEKAEAKAQAEIAAAKHQAELAQARAAAAAAASNQGRRKRGFCDVF